MTVFVLQRNPGAVRQPEEDRSRETLEMDLLVEVDKSSVISPHLPTLCEEARGNAHAREGDLRAWASTPKGTPLSYFTERWSKGCDHIGFRKVEMRRVWLMYKYSTFSIIIHLLFSIRITKKEFDLLKSEDTYKLNI